MNKPNGVIDTREDCGQHEEPQQGEKGGILNAIQNMSSWVRIAVASLGLLGVAPSGCAHAPKVVPASQMQEQRQVCVAWAVIDKGEQLKPLIAQELEKYLTRKYTNLNVRDLNKVWRFSAGCLACSSIVQTIPSLRGYIHENLSFFIGNYCDDIIVMKVIAEVGDSYIRGELHNVLHLKAGSYVFNVQKGREIINNDDNRSWNEARQNDNVPLEQLANGLDIDGVIEYSLETYRPDQLPPLSIATIEKSAAEPIITYFSQLKASKSAPGKVPVDFGVLLPQAEEYLGQFPNGASADEIRGIVDYIEADQQRVAEQERPRQELREGRNVHVQKLRREIELAQQAERNGDYGEAERHFAIAQQTGYLVAAAYKSAGIPVPRATDELALEIERGLRDNQGRIGIPQPKPPVGLTDSRPGAGFFEDAKMLAEEALIGARAITPPVARIAEKLGNSSTSAETSGTSPGNGEIEVETGATGGLSGMPCTDTGTALRLPIKEEKAKTCTTLSGPACTIFDLSPGKYAVFARRSGGCKVKGVGPVQVTVELGKRIRVDFSKDLR